MMLKFINDQYLIFNFVNNLNKKTVLKNEKVKYKIYK